jgi:L-serine deaminase
MIKITKTVRQNVRQLLADSASYDADTMIISRDGAVSALKDANKTYAGHDPVRYLVGHVADMVPQDGVILDKVGF